tara:strand:- start:1242 stop:1493 length:252 start_codon:yes stop_codon:yes gene_type:complete
MLSKVEKYLNQLTKKEKIAMEIAKEILGDSFDITKSTGFIKWEKDNKVQQKSANQDSMLVIEPEEFTLAPGMIIPHRQNAERY